jgi:hypothetical protein
MPGGVSSEQATMTRARFRNMEMQRFTDGEMGDDLLSDLLYQSAVRGSIASSTEPY